MISPRLHGQGPGGATIGAGREKKVTALKV